jgi:hypothetical protein
MANPQLMAALMSGQLGQNPAGSGLMETVMKMMGGSTGGSNPGNELYVLAGMGLSEIMRNIPKVANSMMDLQSAKNGGDQPEPGSLPTAAEPQAPPPQGGGLPPPMMGGGGMPPPPQGGGGAPPGAAMALLQMIRQRQMMGG